MKYASQIPQEKVNELLAYVQQHPDAFRYPRPAKPIYDVATNDMEKVFWAYKCWIQALEVPEKDSGLERYFRSQNLSFRLPPDFIPEASVSVSAGGDLMAVDCITDEFTPHLFDGIRDFYLDADLTMANLESTVFDQVPAGRHSFPNMPAKMNTSQSMLDKFYEDGRGINFFSTANNHCWDFGEEGLQATLDQLKQHGCWYCGTNEFPEEHEQASVFEKNGIRFGMMSFTCDMNGNQYEKPWRINEVRFNDLSCDLSLVQKQVDDAVSKQADILIVHAHWGWEFEMYPHTNIVETAHKIAEMGVDVIVGSHPHVAQPMEKYEYELNGIKRQCLIIYSLGDFVSFHPMTTDSHLTYVVRFDVVKGRVGNEQTSFITNLKCLPVYIMAAHDEEQRYDFRLLRFEAVCQDAAGMKTLPLDAKDIAELPHLRHVLSHILLPEHPEDLIAE